MTDIADYTNPGVSGLTQGITVNWAAGTVTGQAGIIGTDQLIGIEGVFGTQFNDTFNATGYTVASQAAGDFASATTPISSSAAAAATTRSSATETPRSTIRTRPLR